MKITKALLRASGLYNGHDIARHGPEPRVYIRYSPQETGSWYWAISVPGKQTDSTKSKWEEGGDMAFGGWHYITHGHKENKEHALGDAKAKAAELFGLIIWERSSYGDWHPAGTIKAAYGNAKGAVAGDGQCK